jgi:hypothetical protein
VLVNGEVVRDGDFVVRTGMSIVQRLHVHEPPVTGAPVLVTAASPSLLVVDKPASIPVHATARYRYNTILSIIEREHGYPELFRMCTYLLACSCSWLRFLVLTDAYTPMRAYCSHSSTGSVDVRCVFGSHHAE